MLSNRLSLTIFSFTLFFLTACQNEANKLAYVESDRLLIEYKETKIAAEEVKKNTELVRNQFDTLRTELEQLQKEFQEKIGGLSQDERREVEFNLNRKQDEVNRYYNIMSEKIKEEDEKATAEVLKKINKVVQEYGKKKGYTYIFGATKQGNIVFAKDAQNITDEIIDVLNE